MTNKSSLLTSALVIGGVLSGCSSRYTQTYDTAPAIHPVNIEQTADAVPRIEAKSRGGNPRSYQVFGKTYYVLDSSIGFVEQGIASWYGTKFHGNKTSNGETYDMYAMTAAHKSLPLPCYVEVKNLANGKTIIVRVNDRGPFHTGRIIDLSYAAAAKLGTLKNGTSRVEIKAINLSSNTLPGIASTRSTAVKPLAVKQQIHHKQLFIQLGAFKTQRNAQRLQQQLKIQLSLFSSITPLSKDHSTLYLVRVGPYPSMTQAEQTRLRLQQLGIVHTQYIRQ